MSLSHWSSYNILAAGALIVGTKLYFRGAKCSFSPNLNGKIAIMTGANCGIGYYTALRLSGLGATVVLACRDPSRTQIALDALKKHSKSSSVEFIKLDLGNNSSIREFVNTFKSKYDRLDILVNNAGIFNLEKKLTADGNEETFGVNYLGHFMLTCLLKDHLIHSSPSRIINVSSDAERAGKIDVNDLMSAKAYASFVVYSNSKLAQMLFTQEIHRRYESLGIKSVSLQSGAVRKEIFRALKVKSWVRVINILASPLIWLFMKSSIQGAQKTLYCFLVDDDKLVGGGYYSECKVSK